MEALMGKTEHAVDFFWIYSTISLIIFDLTKQNKTKVDHYLIGDK